MSCPTCGGPTLDGGRCAVCDTPKAPRVEGALAADPRLVTPPSRGSIRSEARREALPKKREGLDGAWRDEVRERLRSRRQRRADAGLPLFEQSAVEQTPKSSEPVRAGEGTPRSLAGEPGASPRDSGPDSFPPEMLSPGLSEAELADLPLRPGAVAQASGERPCHRPSPSSSAMPSLEEDELAVEQVDEPEVEVAAPPADPAPLERPARAGERAQAAAIDAALFAVVGLVAVYFAGRAARVGLVALAGAWPWLTIYLGLLAVYYAAYFTGTTGQTPGKLMMGLRVVDTRGRAPGYRRASARAVLGVLGIALGGLGLLPMAFDPAIRGLHDRLFRTRVIRH